MIAGRVIVDLSFSSADVAAEAHNDRRKLEILGHCPDGVEVTVNVGARRFVSQDAASWLHRHDERLRITIEGSSPDAVQTFVRSARAGEWSVAS